MQKIIPAFMQINVRFPHWREERIGLALHRWRMAGTQSESCYLSHLLNTRRILLFEFHQSLWQTSFMPDKVRVNYYCSCHDDRRGLNKTVEWINTNIYRGLDEYRKWVFLGRRGLSARISADGDPLTHMVMGSVFCGTVMMMMIVCYNILQ